MNTIGRVMGMPQKIKDSARKVTSGVASNGTQQRSLTRSNIVGKSKPRWTNSLPANQAVRVKKEPAKPAPSNQKTWVKKDAENPSSEASSSKRVAVEKGYMRTTQSFSAKERGKAKVGETGDLEAVKRRKQEDRDRPKHHIRFDFSVLEEEDMEGGDEEHGSCCIICEQDLSSSPACDDEDDEYGYYMENNNLPEVGVLGCGHCYHGQCLESITPDDLIADPPCLICLS